jgi:hypothetical protein
MQLRGLTDCMCPLLLRFLGNDNQRTAFVQVPTASSAAFFENGDRISALIAAPGSACPVRKIIPNFWSDYIADPTFAHQKGEDKNEFGTRMYRSLRILITDLQYIESCIGALCSSTIQPHQGVAGMRSGTRWLPKRVEHLRKKLEGAFVGVMGDVLEVTHDNVEEIEKILIPQLPGAFTFFLLQRDSDVATALELASSDCKDVMFFSLEGRCAHFDCLNKHPMRSVWND